MVDGGLWIVDQIVLWWESLNVGAGMRESKVDFVVWWFWSRREIEVGFVMGWFGLRQEGYHPAWALWCSLDCVGDGSILDQV